MTRYYIQGYLENWMKWCPTEHVKWYCYRATRLVSCVNCYYTIFSQDSNLRLSEMKTRSWTFRVTSNQKPQVNFQSLTSEVNFHIVCVLVSQLCPTPCDPTDCTCQAPLSMEFSRQEYWRGLPFLSPGDLPNPGAPTGRQILYCLSHQKHMIMTFNYIKYHTVLWVYCHYFLGI